MKVAVIGIGQTKFGELWHQSLSDLLAHSQLAALSDAGIKPHHINALVVGNMSGESAAGQLHLGSLAAHTLNLNVPSVRVEGACASGSLALQQGMALIQAGKAEVVLVSGVEKLTDVDAGVLATSMIGASLQEADHFVGLTFPSLFALITRLYFNEHGITRTDLAHVSVKNHRHGALNPNAHFTKEITLETALNAPMVADPLGLFDCAPITDGAASLMLSTPEFAQQQGIKPVFIVGSGVATDSLMFGERAMLTSFAATKLAAQRAYEQAGLGPRDINLVEVHDAFTMAELMALEDLGFFQLGQAASATAQGVTALGGRLPVNMSGGLKAQGHPVGATGLAQVIELVRQLRGVAGKRQVANVRTGLAHNMGGIGSTVVVHILAV
ncbi:thiolase domain-containing protein [Candidatus Babeliales bacterium]|nr:thiolase domain-containing protein [Candidatus Babeliales bacterium]